MFQMPISWQHLHPVLVHFTTALLPASLASDAAGRVLGRGSLNQAAFWMVLYAAIATPLSAAAGWMWAGEIISGGGVATRTLATHQYLGFVLAAGYVVLAAWRTRTFLLSNRPGIAYLVAASVVTAFLLYQGYLGGKMTIG